MAEKYQIELESTLEVAWSEWLGNLHLTHTPDGRTILTGELADQCALHGLLGRIRDLGLPIVLVARLPTSERTR